MSGEPNPPAPFPEREGGEEQSEGTGGNAARGELRASAPPSLRGKGDGGLGSSLHAVALVVFLGLWTWKLIEPTPVPESLSKRLGDRARFVAAKGLHAGGYCFLTVLAVALPVPTRWRWRLAGLLALHGVATEIGQTYVPGRFGSARDVFIDWVGVGLGVLMWQLWSRRAAARAERQF